MENDLNELIGHFLSQPDSMEKLQGMLSAFGGVASQTPSEAPSAPPSAPPQAENAFLQNVLPLLQGMGGKGDGDRNVALLRALRPFLHDGREKRVDEAIDMMRLMKMLPLLADKPQGGGGHGS